LTKEKNKMIKKLLVVITFFISVITQAQDTTHIVKIHNPTTMVGIELTYPSPNFDTIRGLINPNITIPQNVCGWYNLIHYGSVGYSFHTNQDYNLLFSYGIGIPFYEIKGMQIYGTYILGYHYRPNRKDYRMRRIRVSYRTNKWEVSTSYTMRHTIILGFSYNIINKQS